MILPPIQHQYVNWRDGMKIGQRHLTDSDLAVRDGLRDASAIRLTSHSYGLLPADDGTASGLSLSFSSDTVQVVGCRAITPGGVRIEWQPAAAQPPLTLSLLDHKHKLGNAGLFYVIVRCNPFRTVEIGEYRTGEMPMRRPHVAPKPELDLLSAFETLSDAFSLPVFRVRYEGQLFSPDYDYIPPSVCIHGESLQWYYTSCGTLLGNIQHLALQIVKKIGGMANRSGTAASVHRLMEKVLILCAEISDYYRLVVKELPPVYMAECFMRLARLLRVSFDCLPEADASALFHYFQNMIAGTTSVFKTPVPAAAKSLIDAMIDNVLVSQYNHNDSTAFFDSTVRFMDFLEFLCHKLLLLNYADNRGSWDIYSKT